MQKYEVSGMSCAACSARVEKAVSAVEGVSKCSVNLLTNSMTVEGSAPSQTIIQAVQKAGYGANLAGSGASFSASSGDCSGKSGKNNANSSVKNANTAQNAALKSQIWRLVASVAVMLPLMYFAMGHMVHLPLPAALNANPVAVALAQMLLAITVMLINSRFFTNGFKSLLHRAPNMDTLIGLGSGASFVYSVWVLFAMTAADSAMQNHHLHQLYFESAAMILTLISVGKLLETISKGRTTDALKSLMNLAPKTANVERNGETVKISIEELAVGDIFTVKPGENIPTDGTVIEGSSAVDESNLTGESVPVDKKTGDTVKAATTNIAGFLKCRATQVGEDTSFAQIIQLVSDASASKAPIAKIADKVSGIFVPSVLGIAAFTLCIWLLLGKDFAFALSHAISVLVISCPCALGLATPVAIMVASGVGAKNGILFKTAESLEETGKVKTIAFDKTGTLTKGKPKITDIVPAGSFSRNQLLSLAFGIESKSEHPLAKAVVEYCRNAQIEKTEVSDFVNSAGNGLLGTANGKKLAAGSYNFISGQTQIAENIKQRADELADEGKTPLFFSYGGELLGLIAVADVLKEESAGVIKELKKMGLEVVIISGDNSKTANAIAAQAGVGTVFAGVMPDQKSRIIEHLKQKGKVAMVGDGVNDAPALTVADIGIAIGAGTDVAIDAADLVLVKSNLHDVAAAIKLSRHTLTNIRQNLFWAFIFNVLGIPLAAGAFIHLFGIGITPMFGAAAMSLSSFIVVTNALRLNLVKIGQKGKNKPQPTNTKGDFVMEKTMKIEGMMCGHCEARVKQTLDQLDGVAEAVVSHQNGSAVVKLNKEVSDQTLKEAVENQGYKVTEIK
ncbi:MAG: heavy metal translocating P-type ATPase [Treponemataceae bacterium]|nr:heavy metal translocating P-type ATPase [Treponemataceae bacterium]